MVNGKLDDDREAHAEEGGLPPEAEGTEVVDGALSEEALSDGVSGNNGFGVRQTLPRAPGNGRGSERSAATIRPAEKGILFCGAESLKQFVIMEQTGICCCI